MQTMTQCASLGDYLTLAKKMISKFAPKFYTGLKNEMLQSEDAISDVATAIMLGDSRFDPTRKGKTQKSKTPYSYRNQCAIWAIKSYVTSKYKKDNGAYQTISLDRITKPRNDQEYSLHEIFADPKQTDPSFESSSNEQINIIKNDLNTLLESGVVNEKQKEQIKRYYIDDLSLNDIGKEFGVSREAVRLNIKKGLENIRQLVK
jgi:RNA polymerase sigma factor (sigma-70 family)